jgi:hypothetical protein
MKYFISFFQKFLLPKELPKQLGRWNIEKCNEKLKVKVDLSNEDHCGPCGQYVKTQMDKQNKDKQNKDSKIHSSTHYKNNE